MCYPDPLFHVVDPDPHKLSGSVWIRIHHTVILYSIVLLVDRVLCIHSAFIHSLIHLFMHAFINSFIYQSFIHIISTSLFYC